MTDPKIQNIDPNACPDCGVDRGTKGKLCKLCDAERQQEYRESQG